MQEGKRSAETLKEDKRHRHEETSGKRACLVGYGSFIGINLR